MMHRAIDYVVAIGVLSGSVIAQTPSWQVVVLGPGGEDQAQVSAIRRGVQYGTISHTGTGMAQGGFWQGSPGSWSALTSSNLGSEVNGVDETQQVGTLGIAVGH